MLHVFLFVKRTESVIDATVTIHSEPDILKHVGGDNFGIMGFSVTAPERLLSVE
jgi:hypothetical protein